MRYRQMRCPYCDSEFTITEDALHYDETFECPYCHQANAGSSEANELGILIGVSILDYELEELLAGR